MRIRLVALVRWRNATPISPWGGSKVKRQAAHLMIAMLLAVLCSASRASAAPAESVAKKQRIAVEVKFPVHAADAAKGTFVLTALTSGQLKLDFGSIRSSPTEVFSGRIVGGQSVDRFRGTDTFTGKRGTLVLRFQEDFVSAGAGYLVAAGTWSIVSGTGAYAGLTGGGRSAVVVPPSPGKFGLTQYEGFVTMP